MKKIFSCLLISLSINIFAQVTINPNIFGQNAWYIDVTPGTSASTFDAKLQDLLPEIQASGVKYMRIGGIGPNWDPLYNFTGTTVTSAPKLINLINAMRSYGIEPIIQVSYNPNPGGCHGATDGYGSLDGLTRAQQASLAGSLVSFINNATTGVSPNVDYWIIGNEPDLPKVSCADPRGYGLTNVGLTDAPIISLYLRDFSFAMKTASPNIMIIGPELASFGNDIYYYGHKLLKDLISDATLMGTIGGGGALNTKYYIDIISFHTYPDITDPSTGRADVIANPTKTHNGFKNKISSTATGYKGIVELITTYSSRTNSNIGIACTEFNLEDSDINSDELTEYGDMIKNFSNRSFLGGQWIAEIFSEAMKSGWIDFMTPWSVQEGDCSEGKGYISDCGSGPDYNKRPTYWHYQIIANNFKGTYFDNKYLTGSGSGVNYKAFAYTNTTASVPEVGVIIMNQTEQSSPRGSDNSTQTLEINFNNSAPTSGDIRFQFDCTVPNVSQYSCKITKETTMFLAFKISDGTLLRKSVYTLGDALRTTDTGPETWVLPSTVTLSTQLEFDNHLNAIYKDVAITPATSITEGSTDNKTFLFTNTAIVNGVFTVPVGATFNIIPSTSCP